eukprot:3594451-Pleurochrysis_carterae.AAC.1
MLQRHAGEPGLFQRIRAQLAMSNDPPAHSADRAQSGRSRSLGLQSRPGAHGVAMKAATLATATVVVRSQSTRDAEQARSLRFTLLEPLCSCASHRLLPFHLLSTCHCWFLLPQPPFFPVTPFLPSNRFRPESRCLIRVSFACVSRCSLFFSV